MKKLFVAIILLSSLSLSAQDLVVTYQQDMIRRVPTYELSSNEYVFEHFIHFNPGIKASWRGITTGVNYNDIETMFFWHAGYTLTITPNACLRTYGEGFKLGFTGGRSFTPYYTRRDDQYLYQNNFFLGYQRKRWFAEVYLRNTSIETNYGIGVGYAFM